VLAAPRTRLHVGFCRDAEVEPGPRLYVGFCWRQSPDVKAGAQNLIFPAPAPPVAPPSPALTPVFAVMPALPGFRAVAFLFAVFVFFFAAMI
jgi:hypothetical protein